MKAKWQRKINAENFRAIACTRDGKEVIVRAIKPSDKALLLDETLHMSERSMYYRFFVPKKALTQKELAYFTEIDFHKHVALVALVKENNSYVHAGCGRFILMSNKDKVAEIAFDIKDEYQGHGLGTILFNFLNLIAQSHGIKEFRAEVLAENSKMIEVFDHTGLELKKKYLPAGIVQINIILQPLAI